MSNSPISIVEWQEVCEGLPGASYEFNEAKKKYKREQPKVYRNGTGKRTKTMKALDSVYEVECDEQVMLEEKLAEGLVELSAVNKISED